MSHESTERLDAPCEHMEASNLCAVCSRRKEDDAELAALAMMVEGMKATAAPWEADDSDPTIEGPNGGAVCHIAENKSMHTIINRGEDWNKANVRLIVALRNAAPDLLRVVERVAQFSAMRSGMCEFCGTDDDANHEEDCTWRLARKLVGAP